MATLLDAAILEHFTQIFSMVLVIAVVYGILQFTKAMEGSKGLHILIAFVFGLLVLLIPDVSKLIGTMLPWFTLFFIFILFLLVSYKIFGVTDDDISHYLKGDRTLGWVIFIICLVIVIASFANVYGQRLLTPGQQPATTGDDGLLVTPGTDVSSTKFSSNLGATFFHPKILGLILVFLIAVFTIAILAMEQKLSH